MVCVAAGPSNRNFEMNSETIAAVLATLIGLAVAAYAFAYVSPGDTYKSESQVKTIEMPKAPIQATPVEKGPVVRDLGPPK
jgi:hypothetical protein